MAREPVRYRSHDEDSGRWLDFDLRAGDIVISTRSRSGTTWMQMICALLIFQDPELPAPLPELSPWIDWLVFPKEPMLARLDAQQHRRFVKTHTPLDGIPIDHRATYIIVARSPLEQWLPQWIDWDGDRREQMDSLPGVMSHLDDAWSRRDELNVVLVHYDDLTTDLGAEMRKLAARLGIDVPDDAWPALVDAATFTQMRARADLLVPDADGVLKDRAAFFRRGTSGAGRELLSEADLERYRNRTARLAAPDLVSWLHRDEIS